MKHNAFVAAAVALVLSAAAAQPTLGQEAKPSSPAASTEAKASDQLEEVVIVGSRLRRTVYDSPSPIMVMTREETTLAGYSTTTESLQSSSVTGGSSQINNAYGGYVVDGGSGVNTIGLRGLGAGRTLVLLNGRRVAPAGTRGAVGTADLNTLPSAMIDRIEILRDGASSIYGSDAIAGVINILTRQNLDGVHIEGQYNDPTEGGGETSRLSLSGGLNGDRFHVAGSFEYYERKDLTLGDRDWTLCNQDFTFNRDGTRRDFVDPKTGSYKCYPITGSGSNGVTINTLGTPTRAGVGAAGSVGTTFNRWRPNPAVTTGIVGYEGVGGGSNNLNVRDTFAPYMLNDSLISPAKIYTLFAEGRYDLQALGNAELYGELLGNQRKSSQLDDRQLTLDYPFGSPLIPAGLQFPTAFLAAGGSTMIPGPTGVRGFIGWGNYESSQEVDYYKGTIGLRGDLAFEGWRYDGTLSYSKTDAEYTSFNFYIDRISESVDAVAAPPGTDPALVRNGLTCRINLTNPSRRCILAPPATPETISRNLPADWVAYFTGDDTGNNEYEETVATFNVDGPLFNMPAGQVLGAFGLEYRDAEIDDTPSINSQTGNLYGFTSSLPTRGSDSVAELYAEMEFPLVRDQPFTKDLTLNLSGRYTDYESYGSDTTYKIGLNYAPTDWVSFRGTYGTSYRAPALFEQFLGATSGFQNALYDPCYEYGTEPPDSTLYKNCASEGLPPDFRQNSSITVLSIGGTTTGLEAETSDNLTVGMILQPSLAEGWGSLALAVDYYDIQIDNGVAQAGFLNILGRCYEDPEFRSGGSWCNFVNPRTPGSNALTVRDGYTNIATQVVTGIDYNLRYERDLGPGSIRLNLALTQYLDQKSKLFAEDPWDEYNGTLNNPEYVGDMDLTYTFGSWKIRYGLQWIDGMDSTEYLGLVPVAGSDLACNSATSNTCYMVQVPDYYLHNLSVQYSSDRWSAILGVRNLDNTNPPWMSATAGYSRVGNGPLYSGYDYVGRQVFMNFTLSF